MNRILIAALGAGALFAFSSFAQDTGTMETVVVSGVRGDAESVPHATLVRRADHVITTIRVTCDTRDYKARTAELRDTLRNLIREAAKSKTISLGVGNGVLQPFDEAKIDKIITPDSRPDTSMATIVVKTAITKEDSFDGATQRITDFVQKTPKIGRSEILNDKNWELTIVGPQQYHSAVAAKIAEETKQLSALFGSDYGVHIEGLEHPVAWYRSGLLDLALYIPFALKIEPR